MVSLDTILTKDPEAVLDYAIDWDVTGDSWLSGDTISSVTWTVPTGLTKGSESNTTTTATVWLSGGTAGSIYSISCKIVTAGGRTDERTFKLKVEER